MTQTTNFLSIVLYRKNLKKFTYILFVNVFLIFIATLYVKKSYTASSTIYLSDASFSDLAILKGSFLTTYSGLEVSETDNDLSFIISSMTSRDNINKFITRSVISRNTLEEIFSSYLLRSNLPIKPISQESKIKTKLLSEGYILVELATDDVLFAEYFSENIASHASILASRLIKDHYTSLLTQMKAANAIRFDSKRLAEIDRITSLVNESRIILDTLYAKSEVIDDKESVKYIREEILLNEQKKALYELKLSTLTSPGYEDYESVSIDKLLSDFSAFLDRQLIVYSSSGSTISNDSRSYAFFLSAAAIPFSFFVYILILSFSNIKRYY